MTDPKDIKKLFSDELDNTLFESLEFNSKMKDEVKRKVTSNKNSLVSLKRVWEKRIFPIITIAAIFIISLISISLFQQDQDSPKRVKENEISTFQLEDDNSNLISGRSTNNVLELKDMSEAKQVFGKDLRFPTYSPESFELERIHGLRNEMNEVSKVILTYHSNELIYSVIIERTELQNIPLGFEVIDINGVRAYLKKVEGDVLDAELHWYINDVHYRVSGLISTEETIKIAQSFK
jgi:hypothetical protein